MIIRSFDGGKKNEVCLSPISFDEGLYLKLFPEYLKDKGGKPRSSISTPRRPYLLQNEVHGKINYAVAQSNCLSSHERKHSDVCTLEEVCASFNSKDPSDNEILLNPFWTKESCHGCWKKRKGTCGKGDPDWDLDYHMVAKGVNVDSKMLMRGGYTQNVFKIMNQLCNDITKTCMLFVAESWK